MKGTVVILSFPCACELAGELFRKLLADLPYVGQFQLVLKMCSMIKPFHRCLPLSHLAVSPVQQELELCSQGGSLCQNDGSWYDGVGKPCCWWEPQLTPIPLHTCVYTHTHTVGQGSGIDILASVAKDSNEKHCFASRNLKKNPEVLLLLHCNNFNLIISTLSYSQN
jgi:hypothetical protein